MTDDQSQSCLPGSGENSTRKGVVLSVRLGQGFAARVGIFLGLVLAIPSLGLSLVLVLWASRKLDALSADGDSRATKLLPGDRH
jgi:hypothetical protein